MCCIFLRKYSWYSLKVKDDMRYEACKKSLKLPSFDLCLSKLLDYGYYGVICLKNIVLRCRAFILMKDNVVR